LSHIEQTITCNSNQTHFQSPEKG